MITLPKSYLDLIRSDAIDDAVIWLLQFDLTTGVTRRYARYSQDVTHDGYTYSAWAFESSLQIGGKGHEIPTADLTIADAVYTLRPDALATNWFRDCTLTTHIMCVGLPDLDYSGVSIIWDIKHAAAQGQAIRLKLGGTNIRKVRFPPEQYFAWQCPYSKGFTDDPRCGYSGTETSCNGTFARCVELGMETHYGGWLGLDPGAAKLVVPIQLRGVA